MAKMHPPKVAQALIRDKARLAIQRIGAIAPFRMAPPYEKQVVYANAELAEGRTFDGQRVERVDAVTIVYRSNDLLDVLTMW
jgi:D-amino peptidase